ncbi:MAG TPA: class I SAM-dependent methyltransferase [Pyrinomonadaceae bacterium]|nr:class I SAM-dependent methyltransferase [Pyrinomonadaceae bacterium]
MESRLNLREQFGSIDVYLFDQLLKGRFDPRMRILDAGCGTGRNLVYFLREGFDVCGVDLSPEAVASVATLAGTLAAHLPEENFRLEPIERMSFAPESFDAVISSAVLHFARDEAHWRMMLGEMWRVLKPGGIFFARLASSAGAEGNLEHLGGRRYRLPGGGEWFLTDERMLRETTDALHGELLEPLKTVVVHGARSMAVWCLRKL